jgi:hypothetical protein
VCVRHGDLQLIHAPTLERADIFRAHAAHTRTGQSTAEPYTAGLPVSLDSSVQKPLDEVRNRAARF